MTPRETMYHRNYQWFHTPRHTPRSIPILFFPIENENQVCFCCPYQMLLLTTCEVNHDPIQELHSELSRRRMAYHSIPTRGLVFASDPTSRVLPREILESPKLSSDAPINHALIEYEGWLSDAISTLSGTPRELMGQQQYTRTKLIEEIRLATEEVHTAKKNEWSRQLVEKQTSVPLPSFVIDNQCTTVGSG
jgi:hypothetical protein